LAEAESELVAGFHTEYSGLRWSFFFMAEYGSMFAVSGLAAILFFGGWNGPIPIFHGLGWSTSENWWLFQIANLFGALNFIFKACLGVTLMMWVRWTLPRLRIDQVMTTCLKYCTPLAAACFLGVVLWQMYVRWSPNDLALGAPFRNRIEVREQWVVRAERGLSAVRTAGSNAVPQVAEVAHEPGGAR
jgi:NADH-quinone oxidoreductase subunit H